MFAMRNVSARAASRSFPRLLRAALRGEEVVITRLGRPIARLTPEQRQPSTALRERAFREMVEMMRKGIPLGGRPFTRDEMHER
jgi:prevent-host-death family protein